MEEKQKRIEFLEKKVQTNRLIEGYVEHYNNVRLNSATGYITPKDMLAGRQQEIHSERDRKLARRAEYSLTENVASPFQAEPRQVLILLACLCDQNS